MRIVLAETMGIWEKLTGFLAAASFRRQQRRAQPAPEPETPDVVGTYQEKNNKDFEIKIEKSDDAAKGEYKVTVTRKNAAGEKTKWVFYGSFDGEGKLSYTKCEKTSETEGEAVYKDGRGTLLFDKETKRLTWKDEKENVAKDLVFEKK